MTVSINAVTLVTMPLITVLAACDKISWWTFLAVGVSHAALALRFRKR